MGDATYFISKPTWCSFKQSHLFFTAISLYMFRVLSAPISRSTIKTLDTFHVSVWCGLNPLKGVQGRESIAQYHGQVRTPDDGCRKHPKHVEWNRSKE
jgi:hypothetical protein